MGYIFVFGRCLIVFYYSFVTYDIILLVIRVREVIGCVLRFLIDRVMFYFLVMGCYLRKIGNVLGDLVFGEEFLEKEELVLVVFGGMWEVLCLFMEWCKIVWDFCKGFVCLVIKIWILVIFFVCLVADDIYIVYDSLLIKVIYNWLWLLVVLVSGIGFIIVFWFFKLIIYLSVFIDFLEVDVDDEKVFNEVVD